MQFDNLYFWLEHKMCYTWAGIKKTVLGAHRSFIRPTKLVIALFPVFVQLIVGQNSPYIP